MASHFRAVLVLGLALSLSCDRGTPVGKGGGPSTRIIKPASAPPGFSDPQAFLDLIKLPSEPSGRFDPANAPHWNIDRFMSFMSEQGVVLTDVNDSSHRTVSANQLRSELISRKGEAFKTFAHLAHIYSMPYRQYSEVSYQKVSHGSVLALSYGYTLTFALENGQQRLVRCDLTASEGE